MAVPLPTARGGSRSGSGRHTGRDANHHNNRTNNNHHHKGTTSTPYGTGGGKRANLYGSTVGGAPTVSSQRSGLSKGKGQGQGGPGSSKAGQRVTGGHHASAGAGIATGSLTGDHLEGGGGLMDVDNIDEWTSLNLLHDYPNDERMQQQPRSSAKVSVSTVGVSGARERDGSVLSKDDRMHLMWSTGSGKVKQKIKKLSLKQQQKDFIYLTERRKSWVS